MAAAESITVALLAGLAGGHVFPQFRPQNGPLPAVVWNVISVNPQGRLSQTVGTGLWSARVQVDCIAGSFSALKSLVDDVRAAMHLKSGTIGGKTVVSSILDQINADAVDIDAGIYFQPVDFILTFYD